MVRPKILWMKVGPDPDTGDEWESYVGHVLCKRDGVIRTVAMVEFDLCLDMWAWHLIGSGIGHMGYENDIPTAKDMAELSWLNYGVLP